MSVKLFYVQYCLLYCTTYVYRYPLFQQLWLFFSGVFASTSASEQHSGHWLSDIPNFPHLLNSVWPYSSLCRKFLESRFDSLWQLFDFFCFSVGRGRSRATITRKISHVSFLVFKMFYPSSDIATAYVVVSLCTLNSCVNMQCGDILLNGKLYH